MPEPKNKRTVASLFRRPLLAGAMAAAAAAPAPALAQIFLDLDGIDGESQDSKHKNQIDILSYTQSFRNVVPPAGGGAGKVTCGDVTLLKNIDKSSPKLIQAVTTGKHIQKGVLTFNITGKSSQLTYYTVTLTDILVSSIDQSDQPDPARIVERTTLSPAVFEFEYKPQKADGTLDAGIKFKYDCKINKAE